VKVAAQSFRPNPKLDVERTITEMGKGEALTSFLEGNGVPAMVDRTFVRPPAANVGPVTEAQRKAIIDRSPVKGLYDTPIDRESAYEKLQNKAEEMTSADAPGGTGGVLGGIGDLIGGIFGTNRKRGEKLTTGQKVARDVTRTVTNRVAGQVAADLGKKVAGSVGGSIGRAIIRGTLGSILRR